MLVLKNRHFQRLYCSHFCILAILSMNIVFPVWGHGANWVALRSLSWEEISILICHIYLAMKVDILASPGKSENHSGQLTNVYWYRGDALRESFSYDWLYIFVGGNKDSNNTGDFLLSLGYYILHISSNHNENCINSWAFCFYLFGGLRILATHNILLYIYIY